MQCSSFFYVSDFSFSPLTHILTTVFAMLVLYLILNLVIHHLLRGKKGNRFMILYTFSYINHN